MKIFGKGGMIDKIYQNMPRTSITTEATQFKQWAESQGKSSFSNASTDPAQNFSNQFGGGTSLDGTAPEPGEEGIDDIEALLKKIGPGTT